MERRKRRGERSDGERVGLPKVASRMQGGLRGPSNDCLTLPLSLHCSRAVCVCVCYMCGNFSFDQGLLTLHVTEFVYFVR